MSLRRRVEFARVALFFQHDLHRIGSCLLGLNQRMDNSLRVGVGSAVCLVLDNVITKTGSEMFETVGVKQDFLAWWIALRGSIRHVTYHPSVVVEFESGY